MTKSNQDTQWPIIRMYDELSSLICPILRTQALPPQTKNTNKNYIVK